MYPNTRFIATIVSIFAIIQVINQAVWSSDIRIGSEDIVITSVPRTMSYQGILKDSSGNSVEDSVYNVTFRIFNTDIGGLSLWDETLPCTTSAGLFNAIFSNVNVPFDEDYWLEIEVASEILDPRQKINMVGYAARTDTSDYALNAAGGNCNWTVTDSVLYTDNYWGIARGGAGNSITGDNAYTCVNLGVAGSISPNYGDSIQYSAITGGYGNDIESNFSTIAGGESNQVDRGPHSFIGGGKSNYVGEYPNGGYASIVGGLGNSTSGDYSFIGGGLNNWIYYDGICGVIAGGWENKIRCAPEFACNTIGGGYYNEVCGMNGTIGGGAYNYIRQDGFHGTIGGGYYNIAGDYDGGFYSTVGGGSYNTASHGATTIGGGSGNTASSPYSTIAGGVGNTANGFYSTIGGGNGNTVGGQYSAILGGTSNTIDTTADYCYLFGIGSNLTEDSTFMVDMPHIHFGDSTTGYEFPAIDGSSGQVMATDGSGQLSWVNMTAAVRSEMQEMMDTIEELQRQNTELASRITELEKKLK